jgi:hypothetical protein
MIKEKTFSGFNASHRLLASPVLAATWWPNGFNWIMSFVPWPFCMDPYGAPLVLFYLPVSMQELTYSIAQSPLEPLQQLKPLSLRSKLS